MRGILPEQIKAGLEKLVVRENTFPPNAIEFRRLCMPETISPTGMNADAYLSIDDPRHSCYQRPAIEDFGRKARTEKLKAETLTDLKGLFK